MAKTRTAAALIAALLLAGCAGANTVDSPSQTTTPAQTATVNATAPATAGSTVYPDADEISYLESIHESWSGDIPSDSDLVAAGYESCDALSSGAPFASRINDDYSEQNDQNIQWIAISSLCEGVVG